jgi:ADP-heptose:LPS heptosyltransferase
MSSNLLQRLPLESRVAVIRLRSLGDCVLTTPALTLLKQHRPDLELAVVVEDRFAAVFEGNPLVSTILPPTAVAIARWKPELALNFHGGSTSSQLTFASRAKWRAGFEHFRFRALYNVRIPRAQLILGVERKVHTAEHLASAMFFLGVPTQEIPRASLFVPGGVAGRYAVVHAKASAPDKTWAGEKFAAVARHLRDEAGLEPVFIAGPGESLDEFAGFRCVLGSTLAETKALLAGAALFVGNDSGPAHMAAAFGVPVAVIFGSSDPLIWAPWRTESQVVTSPAGIGAIEVDEVLAAVARLETARIR